MVRKINIYLWYWKYFYFLECKWWPYFCQSWTCIFHWHFTSFRGLLCTTLTSWLQMTWIHVIWSQDDLQWLQIMKQVAERNCRVSIFRVTQILVGPVPGHMAVADSAWATEGGLDYLSRSLPASVVLWFCKMLWESKFCWVQNFKAHHI